MKKYNELSFKKKIIAIILLIFIVNMFFIGINSLLNEENYQIELTCGNHTQIFQQNDKKTINQFIDEYCQPKNNLLNEKWKIALN